MESSSLDSVLSGQATDTPTPEVQQPAQVEQPQTVEVEQEATGEDTGTPPEPKQDDPLDKAVKGLETGISAERKRRQEAESRAEAAERRARELEQQFQRPPQQAPQKTDDPKPQKAQFETEDEWLDARDDWRDRQQQRERTEWQQQQAEQAKRARTESVFAEAMKLPGMDFQAFARLPVTDQMADAILESDVSAQMVHYLTANPDEARRISALSNAQQHKAMTRIEDRLTAAPTTEQPKPEDKPRPHETLTQTRNAKGQFEPAYSGPTPLNAILK